MINGRIHYLKLSQFFVDDVFSGRKTFEIRLNDRDFQVGDYIVFTPVPSWNKRHPIEDETYVITYILSRFGLQSGLVAMSIKKCIDEN